MKKSLLALAIISTLSCYSHLSVKAEEMVTIQVPASSIDTIDVKYQKVEPSPTEKAIDATKKATDKTVKVTKEATNKTVKATKQATKKTVEVTKKATDRTVTTTKTLKDKTVDGTKEIIDNLNPNKPVTLEGLEKEAAIKTLKNEKKELTAAYNSRIKDIKAKIKAAENSTVMSDVEKQYQIHSLNKQKESLEEERDLAIEKYNNKIAEQKAKK